MHRVFVFLVISLGLFSTRTTAQHQVSPEGKSYVVYEEVEEKNTEIFIQEFNGKKIRMTHHPYADYNPQWSSDGTEIIFYRKHPEQYQADVFLMSVDGSATTQLTNTPYYDGDPSLSRENRFVSFSSNRDGDFEIFVMTSDGSDVRQLTENDRNDWSPSWSPDSKELVFVSDVNGNFELYVTSAAGSKRRQITSLGGENYKPDWSPDGRWMAFFHRDNPESKFDIFLTSPDGKNVRNITETPEDDEYPCGWQGDEFFYYYPQGIKAHHVETGLIRNVHHDDSN